MRSAYDHSYDVWARKPGVWLVFKAIRGGTWDDITSVNLARCYEPDTRTGEDDAHIKSHSMTWSLDKIVEILKPRIVFVSKHKESDPELMSALRINGENERRPLVVRYSNHSRGWRNKERYTDWVPREAPLSKSSI